MKRQRGAAMMVMLVIMIVGGAAFLVSALSSSALKTARQETTSSALAQAKEALIGRAVADLSLPGSLPCPDSLTNIPGSNVPNDGIADLLVGNDCPSYIGRLPWKTLGLPDLRDGSGERLWYVLSKNFLDDNSNPINSDSTGTLNVSGTTAASNVIAIIFAPGATLSGNSRSETQTAACITTNSTVIENLCAANYLEGSNANMNTLATLNLNFQSAAVSETFNDQLITLAHDQLFNPVEMRIAREARQCLDDYAASAGGRYPWAVPISDTTFISTTGTLFGRFPRLPVTNLDIISMLDAMTALQVAVDNCILLNNSANRNTLDNTGSNLENAAKTVRDNQPTTPAITASVTTSLIDAGNDAQDSIRCSLINSNPTGNSVQTNLDAATDAISALSPPPIWPVSCTLFTSTPWSHWRNMVFYQVADGFKPVSAASCGGSCLSVTGSGHTTAGSGSYHAAVIVAGKKLTANRVITNTSDYLEADNLLPQADSTKPYKTYRVTDSNYPTINDRVLCLDGGVNCK